MLTATERAELAAALDDYAAGVQENLEDDLDGHDPVEDGGGDANDAGTYPVVEDYQNDAERIRMGETPLHELTREVLRDEFGPAALTDDPAAYLELVRRLLGAS